MKALNDAMRYRNRSRIPAPAPSTLQLMDRFPHQPKGSVTALLRKTGPFVPTRDVFGFTNIGWAMTEHDAQILLERYSALIEGVTLVSIHSITTSLQALRMSIFPFGTIGLPAEAITFVVDRVSAELRDQIMAMFVAGVSGNLSTSGEYGRCGGLAFAALDFFAFGRPILQYSDPSKPELRDYIWGRLLDSIEMTGETFLDWVISLKIMPTISRAVTAAIGAAAGQVIAGPMGAAIGTFVAASSGDLLNLGGPGELRIRTREHFEMLKPLLEIEAAWPIGLVYDNQISPAEQHQILALGYTHGDKPLLDIWDNNDRQCGRRLMLDFAGEELMVTDMSTTDSRHNSKTTEKIPHIKGIICGNYTFQQPPATL